MHPIFNTLYTTQTHRYHNHHHHHCRCRSAITLSFPVVSANLSEENFCRFLVYIRRRCRCADREQILPLFIN